MSQTPAERAEEIVAAFVRDYDAAIKRDDWVAQSFVMDDAKDAITASLTQSQNEVERLRKAVPEGHVRLPDGRDVKVLGVLPLTADDCAVGIGASVWCTPIVPPETGVYWDTGMEFTEFFEDGGKMMALDAHTASVGGLDGYAVPVSDCYSTREAALSAPSPASEKGGEA